MNYDTLFLIENTHSIDFGDFDKYIYIYIYIMRSYRIHTPDQPPEEFTWVDAMVLLPITLIFSAPFYVMNTLSGGNGSGYQKLIPQFLIPTQKRITKTPTFIESIFY
mgnify:FL=1